MRWGLLLLAGCALPAPPPVAVSDCARCDTSIALFDDMSATFQPIAAAVALDDAPLWSRSDGLAAGPLLDLRVPDLGPGAHVLSLEIVFRGNGTGVFSYLPGYKFDVRSRHAFVARRGLRIEARAYEKGGPTTPFEERPAVRFVER